MAGCYQQLSTHHTSGQDNKLVDLLAALRAEVWSLRADVASLRKKVGGAQAAEEHAEMAGGPESGLPPAPPVDQLSSQAVQRPVTSTPTVAELKQRYQRTFGMAATAPASGSESAPSPSRPEAAGVKKEAEEKADSQTAPRKQTR